MKQIEIKRFLICKDGIFSTLTFMGQSWFTLEHAYPVMGDSSMLFEAKVQVGTYAAVLYYSPKHKCTLVKLLNVPNCTDIEIHIGNFNDDSIGCFCIADDFKYISNRFVLMNSTAGFQNFMALCKTQPHLEVVVS